MSLMTGSHTLDTALADVVKECIFSAETIQLYAQHQKSIVDEYVIPSPQFFGY